MSKSSTRQSEVHNATVGRLQPTSNRRRPDINDLVKFELPETESPSPFVPLVDSAHNIKQPIGRLGRTTAHRAVQFRRVLRNLIIKVHINARVTVVLSTPISTILNDTFSGSKQNGTIGHRVQVVVRPYAISVHVDQVLAETRYRLDRGALVTITNIRRRRYTLINGVIFGRKFAKRLVTPLNEVTVNHRRLANAHMGLLRVQRVARNNITRAAEHHLIHDIQLDRSRLSRETVADAKASNGPAVP